MRLGKHVEQMIADVTRRAMSGEVRIELRARDACVARAIFHAVSPHIQLRGGAPASSDLEWRFSNGSVVAIATPEPTAQAQRA
jgi:hypothetical protein